MKDIKDAPFTYADFETAIAKLRPRDPDEHELDSQAVYETALRIEKRAHRALATEANPRVRAALSEILGCCDDRKFIATCARFFEAGSSDAEFWSYVLLAQVGTPNALDLTHERSVAELLETCVSKEDLRALNLKPMTGSK